MYVTSGHDDYYCHCGTARHDMKQKYPCTSLGKQKVFPYSSKPISSLEVAVSAQLFAVMIEQGRENSIRQPNPNTLALVIAL